MVAASSKRQALAIAGNFVETPLLPRLVIRFQVPLPAASKSNLVRLRTAIRRRYTRVSIGNTLA